ncbi:MAG: DNA polymerase III subunit delta' [Anaerolineae bacterium]|nr:MAG: DNA polymerase III subunit delta' [Anaerolineae bacterium]
MQYSADKWPILGHDWAVDLLTTAFNGGRTRHAYLLTGPVSIGKTTFARAMAMAFNCTAEKDRPCGVCRACTLIEKGGHPDITLIEADRVGGTMKIDQIREMQHILALRPYEARYRVAILRRFHEANAAAQNALLKTLEEPPASVKLILTANDASLLLPTIRSRCQPLPLKPLKIDMVKDALEKFWDASAEQADLLAHLSGGRIGWAIRAVQDDSTLALREESIDLLEALISSPRRVRFEQAEALAKDKDKLYEVLHLWQAYWRDMFLLVNGNSAWMSNIDRQSFMAELKTKFPPETFQRALTATRRTMNYIARNVNTRLAVETMLLDYPFIKGRLM